MLRPRVFVCILALAFCAGLLIAQDPKKEPTPATKFKGQLPANWKKLGLSEDQTQKVYKIQSDYGAKIDELEAKIKELKKESDVKQYEVLTDAQKARLKEILNEKADPTKTTPKPPEKTEPKKDK